MFDPFIFSPYGKWQKDSRPGNQERKALNHGTLMRQPAARNQLTLRLGLLLIRIGKVLAGERTIRVSSREPWLPAHQTETRPARFHHA